MIRCPVCHAVVDSADLYRHLHTHTTLALLRHVWASDRWFTLLAFAAFTEIVAWLLVLAVWP